jgi:EpsI family protein
MFSFSSVQDGRHPAACRMDIGTCNARLFDRGGRHVSMRRNIALCILMIAAAVVTHLLTPSLATGLAPKTPLAAQVPMAFGEWRAQETRGQLIVSPEVAETLSTLYSDTLTRTYVNGRGEAVMLSLAYGTNQGKQLQIHKPEVCYAAQGFKITSQEKFDIPWGSGRLNLMHLIAVQGPRKEPITYWIRSGDVIVRGWFEQNRARILAGLSGVIPDGLLVRVSTISQDAEKGFEVQERFIRDMLAAIPAEHKPMFLGTLGS